MKKKAHHMTDMEARHFISKHIKRHITKYHMTRNQAIAVALSEARKKGYHVVKSAAKKRSNMTDYL